MDGYRAAVPAATLGGAIALGGRAVARNAWLLAAALAVAAGRALALVPAGAVTFALLAKGAALGAGQAAVPMQAPAAALEGALAVAASPRFLLVVAGLWAAGALLAALLRVAWLAGALPTLGASLAGVDPRARFAAGIAWGFPRVLGAAALGWALELAGGGFGLTLAAAVLRAPAHGGAATLLVAVARAGALTLAVAVPVALAVVADGALARAAVRGDGPVRAVAAAGARFLARPGALVGGAITFGILGAAVALGLQAAGGIATGFAVGQPALLVGPDLMIAVATAVAGSAVELWWLATVAVLVCEA